MLAEEIKDQKSLHTKENQQISRTKATELRQYFFTPCIKKPWSFTLQLRYRNQYFCERAPPPFQMGPHTCTTPAWLAHSLWETNTWKHSASSDHIRCYVYISLPIHIHISPYAGLLL